MSLAWLCPVSPRFSKSRWEWLHGYRIAASAAEFRSFEEGYLRAPALAAPDDSNTGTGPRRPRHIPESRRDEEGQVASDSTVLTSEAVWAGLGPIVAGARLEATGY